jgi:hypothetical protein
MASKNPVSYIATADSRQLTITIARVAVDTAEPSFIYSPLAGPRTFRFGMEET